MIYDIYGNDIYDVAAAYGAKAAQSLVENGFYIHPTTGERVERK